MSYTPEIYSPSRYVNAAHNIPRFDYETFQVTGDNEFPTNTDDLVSTDTMYTRGLITLPVWLIVLGIVSVVLMQLLIMFRCCFTCLKCAPNDEDVATEPEKVIKSRNRVFYGFWLFILIMLVADHALYLGNDELDKARDNLVSALTLLKNIFDDINTATLTLIDENQILKNQATAISGGSCGAIPPGSPLDSAVTSMDTAATAMLAAFTAIRDMVKDVPDMLDSSIDTVNYYGSDTKNMGMFSLYGLFLAIVLVFVAGSCLASKWIMWLGLLIGELTCIVSTIVCGIVMVVVTVFGDFCMDPTKNLESIVGDGSVGDLISYYGTCTGNDPFYSDITSATSDLQSYSTDLTSSFSVPCNTAGNGQIVTAANNAILGITNGLQDITGTTTCESLNPVYDKFMNQAFCTNGYGGLFIIWFCCSICSIGLFFAMAYSSVLYQYFGVPWKLRPEDGKGQAIPMEGASSTAYAAPAGYKQEYTFTAASPSAPISSQTTITRKEIEMI